ncbi:MAG: hypothetical protein ABSG62_02555 [Terracidiphilus sp.]
MTAGETQEIISASREAELRALQWLTDRLDYFNPFRAPDAQTLNKTIKPLAELALTCEVANDSAAADRLPIYRNFARFIWDEVFSVEAFRENLLERASGGYAFSIYASLRKCGFEHLAYRQKLQELIDNRYALGYEQLPFVKLNLLHNLKTAGFTWTKPSFKQVYATSQLASHPDLYHVTVLDAYAITHVLFFLTDFGRVEADCLSDADRSYLRRALPRLTEYYIRRRDWDLSAEFLVCLKSAGLEDLSVYRDAWLLLLASQNEDGSFTGPDRLNQADGDPVTAKGAETSAAGEKWNSFGKNYHTTLVALLALMVALPPT